MSTALTHRRPDETPAGLAVAILDLETDLVTTVRSSRLERLSDPSTPQFAPEIFHQHSSAEGAVNAVRCKLQESLLSLPLPQQERSWQLVGFVFW